MTSVGSFCLLLLVAAQAHAQDACRAPAPCDSDKFESASHAIDCPDRGDDPDKLSLSQIAMSKDPTGLSSTNDVVNYAGKGTDRAANHGIRAFMGDMVEADHSFYQMVLAFYTRLKAADALARAADETGSPIERPATGKFDAWTEAKNFAGGNSYLALKILTVFGHDNENNKLKPTTKGPEGCVDRCDVLNKLRPGMSSLLYRNNALAGRWYSTEDVDAGQKIAEKCKAAANPTGCYQLTRFCNDKHDSYQADYYHVIASAFFGCRALKLTSASGTFGLKVEAQKRIAKKYKHERFEEELKEVLHDSNTNDEKSLVPELQRALEYAYGDSNCALPPDLKLEGPCGALARATAEREAFEMCFRARQHALGFDFGYKASGCR